MKGWTHDVVLTGSFAWTLLTEGRIVMTVWVQWHCEHPSNKWTARIQLLSAAFLYIQVLCKETRCRGVYSSQRIERLHRLHLHLQKLQNKRHSLYVFFWVIPRSLNFICRRFGTLSLFHLHRQVGVILHLPAYEDGTGSVRKRRNIKFRRWGITQKKHTTYRTRRDFEIKNIWHSFTF